MTKEVRFLDIEDRVPCDTNGCPEYSETMIKEETKQKWQCLCLPCFAAFHGSLVGEVLMTHCPETPS